MIEETVKWNLDRAHELLVMSEDETPSLAFMALRGSVRHLIKVIQILQSSEQTANEENE